MVLHIFNYSDFQKFDLQTHANPSFCFDTKEGQTKEGQTDMLRIYNIITRNITLYLRHIQIGKLSCTIHQSHN